MPVSHETVVYDVHDAAVYAMLTDAAGASPTYGAKIDVPGIANVGVNPNIVSAELKGDARVMARKGRTDRLVFSATYGKLAGNVLGVILATVTSDIAAAGGVPEYARMRLKSPASLPYFKIEFKIDDLDAGLGTLKVVLWKCQLTGGTLLTGATDAFSQPTFDAEAIALNGTLGADVGVIGDWNLYATPVELTA